MPDNKGFWVLGLRLNGIPGYVQDCHARFFVQRGAARPEHVTAGKLDPESKWQLEDMAREADIVTWERHPIKDGIDDASWAFEKGRINGRLETLMARRRPRWEYQNPPVETWRRYYGVEREIVALKQRWDLGGMSRMEGDAVLIGWWGWINSPEHGA